MSYRPVSIAAMSDGTGRNKKMESFASTTSSYFLTASQRRQSHHLPVSYLSLIEDKRVTFGYFLVINVRLPFRPSLTEIATISAGT